ncbi:MAG: CotH kinase family protein [Propionicimonas sp.]
MRLTILRVLLAFALVAGVTVASQPTARADVPALTAVIKDPVAYPGQSKPLPGQLVTITGDIGDGPRAVTLQKYTTRWSTYSRGTTAADGTFSFDASTTTASRRFRVIAAKTATLVAVTTQEVTVTTLADVVTLSVIRTGNTLQVTGQAKIPLLGRSFALQSKSGSSWIQVTTDPAALAEDATGGIKGKTVVAGSKTYRLLGAAVEGLPAVASNSVAFSASPATLGTNVIYVTTDSGGTPTIKGKDYPGKATLVSGDTVTGPLLLETIAVRGNSSALKPKKPYKLKFLDKQAPFGMNKDKTWVLLANYVDRSLVRTKVAFNLAEQQGNLAWTADSRYTELYINNKYMGSYQLAESIKIAGDRMDLDEKYGQIIENDPHYAEDGVPGFKGLTGMQYSFKDPDEWKSVPAGPKAIQDPVKGWLDPKGLTTAKVAAVSKMIRTFEGILYGQDKKKDWSKVDPASLDVCTWGSLKTAGLNLSSATLNATEWSLIKNCDWEDFLDLDSAVDYILLREFTKDNDADFYRSNFFSIRNYATNDEKFVMGPVWDFDRSAGAHTASASTIQKSTGWWTMGTSPSTHDTAKIHWFTRIWKDRRFVSAVKDRWLQPTVHASYAAFADATPLTVPSNPVNLAVAQMDDPKATAGSSTSQVAANEQARWGSSGARYGFKTKGWATEIPWLKTWYSERYAFMDEAIKKFASLP